MGFFQRATWTLHTCNSESSTLHLFAGHGALFQVRCCMAAHAQHLREGLVDHTTRTFRTGTPVISHTAVAEGPVSVQEDSICLIFQCWYSRRAANYSQFSPWLGTSQPPSFFFFFFSFLPLAADKTAPSVGLSITADKEKLAVGGRIIQVCSWPSVCIRQRSLLCSCIQVRPVHIRLPQCQLKCGSVNRAEVAGDASSCCEGHVCIHV